MFKRSLLLTCLFLVACQANTEKNHDELWQNIVEANESVENYHAVLDSKQSMTSIGKIASADAAIDLYINENPYNVRQTTHTQMNNEQIPPKQYYVNNNTVYAFIPPDFNWFMLQAKEYDDVKHNIKGFNHHLERQIDLISHYNSEYEMNESKSLYEFKINHTSKSFEKLYLKIVNESLPSEFDSILNTLIIEDGSITIEIDKENCYLRKIIASANYTTKVKGIDAKIEQSVLNIYTKQNKTKVSVDEEAIEQADVL